MEDWLEERMSGANQSQLDVIHQLEEQTAEIDDGIGLLQRKIGATEQIAQTVQQELAELTESAEARHTSMMTRIMKNSTAGVSKKVFEEHSAAFAAAQALLDEVRAAVSGLEATVADDAKLKQSAEALEDLVDSSTKAQAAQTEKLAEDLHLLHGVHIASACTRRVLRLESGAGARTQASLRS